MRDASAVEGVATWRGGAARGWPWWTEVLQSRALGGGMYSALVCGNSFPQCWYLRAVVVACEPRLGVEYRLTDAGWRMAMDWSELRPRHVVRRLPMAFLRPREFFRLELRNPGKRAVDVRVEVAGVLEPFQLPRGI